MWRIVTAKASFPTASTAIPANGAGAGCPSSTYTSTAGPTSSTGYSRCSPTRVKETATAARQAREPTEGRQPLPELRRSYGRATSVADEPNDKLESSNVLGWARLKHRPSSGDLREGHFPTNCEPIGKLADSPLSPKWPLAAFPFWG